MKKNHWVIKLILYVALSFIGFIALVALVSTFVRSDVMHGFMSNYNGLPIWVHWLRGCFVIFGLFYWGAITRSLYKRGIIQAESFFVLTHHRASLSALIVGFEFMGWWVKLW